MLSLISSAALGAMIGLIRQWNEQTDHPGHTEYAGLRTFVLWSLLGCLGAFVSDEHSLPVLPVLLAVVGAYFALTRQRPETSERGGSTTFAASLLTLFIGALVYWKRHEEATLVSALVVVLLGLKQPIHAWTRGFTETDIRVTLQFIAVTGIILPLVPDRDLGPFGGFNPHSTWMMVVLISGVGFAGYVLMRLSSARAGFLVTSLLGGLTSSTATTLAFSRRSREDPAHSGLYAMAVAVACTVMLPRLLIVVSFVNRGLAWQLLLPFALMALPGTGFVALNWWHQRRKRAAAPPALANPLGLVTAMKFAALYAFISFLVKAASHFGHLQGALIPLSFLSGLTDVDAIALSVARNLAAGEVALRLAAQAVVVAAIANSALKAGFAAFLGSPKLRWQVASLMAVTVATGVAGVVLLGRVPVRAE